MGVGFSHFRGTTGAKIKKLFEKKSKLFYIIELIVSKLF